MTDTKTAQDQATANSQAPPAPEAEKATSGERAVAIVAGLFGLFILAMAIDMFTGGGLSRLIPAKAGDDGG